MNVDHRLVRCAFYAGRVSPFGRSPFDDGRRTSKDLVFVR
jgi:hypothetical protein